MQSSDSDGPLRPVSCIVLGLLATAGPRTSYELARDVDLSVRFFWPVPRSQLYAEPQRLEELGLVESAQEPGGRMRRTFTITERGRAALIDWLGQPPGNGERRDPAMLRLFFLDAAPDLLASLADNRIAQLEQTVAFLEQPDLGGDQVGHRRVLSWGRAAARADLAFWQSLRDDVPRDDVAHDDVAPS